ncbi:MAG: SUKH-3 domain-containing protein [Planctomycetaceae bacterium]|jgi:hypothetical protein|nr:SUKH-3 domain-containing protein [Planctomycetaceae bacterium]
MSNFSESTLQILKEAGWYPGRSVSTEAFEVFIAHDGHYINDTIRAFLQEFGGITIRINYSWHSGNQLMQSTKKISIGTLDTSILEWQFNLLCYEEILHGEILIPIAYSNVTILMTYSGKIFYEIDGDLHLYPGSHYDFIENICGIATGKREYHVWIAEYIYEANDKITFSDAVKTDDNLKYLLDRSPQRLLMVDDTGYDTRWWKLYGLTMYFRRNGKFTIREVVQKTRDFLNDFVKLCPEWLPFFIPSSSQYHGKSFWAVPSLDTLKEIINEGELIPSQSQITYCNFKDINDFKNVIEIRNIWQTSKYTNFFESFIRFPPFTDGTEKITSKEFIKKVFDLVVKHWQPECGSVASSVPLIKRYTGKYTNDMTGWLTYFSNELGDLPQLHDWVKIIPAASYGNYLQISDELPDYKNEKEFLKATRQLHELDKILNTLWEKAYGPDMIELINSGKAGDFINNLIKQ